MNKDVLKVPAEHGIQPSPQRVAVAGLLDGFDVREYQVVMRGRRTTSSS